jgi:hypothetical protein
MYVGLAHPIDDGAERPERRPAVALEEPCSTAPEFRSAPLKGTIQQTDVGDMRAAESVARA